MLLKRVKEASESFGTILKRFLVQFYFILCIYIDFEIYYIVCNVTTTNVVSLLNVVSLNMENHNGEP